MRLENRGIEHYLEHTLPDMAGLDTIVVRISRGWTTSIACSRSSSGSRAGGAG